MFASIRLGFVSVLLCVSILISSAFAQGMFHSAVNYADPLGPHSVAVGDFNGDGIPDLAVANFDGSNVSIFLGKPDGTFQSPINYATGFQPVAIAVGDFDGNGKLDLVTANSSNSNSISVLLGNGDGSFHPAVNRSIGSNPAFVAVADLNGDGKLDLVINSGSQLVVVLGTSDGTFSGNPLFYSLPPSPSSVAIGDLNGDGRPDVVVTSRAFGSVAILLNMGNGNLVGVSNYPVGSQPQSVAIGDFNGDGKPDLVVVNQGSNNVSVLLSNGGGLFQQPVNFNVGSLPQSVAVTDLNSDGKLDLVVANQGDGSVSLLLGNGAGSSQLFQPAGTYATGSSPQAIAVADFNGDGRPDIVTANYHAIGGNDVSVLLNNVLPTIPISNGLSFLAPRVYSNQLSGHFVAIGDINGDGRPDLAIANYVTNDVTVLLNTATSLQPLTLTVGAGPNAVALGDFNGDGRLDLATANFKDNDVSVLLQGTNGAFQPAVNYSADLGPISIADGDFNGDGKLDLAVVNGSGNSVSVLLGNGDGTFQPAVNYSVGNRPYFVAIGDVNGDGKLDLAVVNQFDNNVSVLLGNGDGTFQPAVNYNTGSAPEAVAIADLNRDGKADLVVANYLAGTVSVLIGKGDGTFQPANSYAAGPFPQSIAVGDFNGDGKLDLVVANNNSGSPNGIVSILPGNGDGSFRQPFGVNVGSNVDALMAAVGDFNSDGKADLIVGTLVGASIVLNTGGTTVAPPVPISPVVFGQSITVPIAVANTLGANTPSGSVQFQDGTANLGGPVPLNGFGGSATAALFFNNGLPAGTHTITALYSGDQNFWTNTGTPFTLTVNRASTTLQVFTINNPATYGNPITLSANINVVAPGMGTPGGTVQFLDGGINLGPAISLSNGIARLTIDGATVPFLAAGTHSISAIYSGSGNYAGSNGSLGLTVNQSGTATVASSLNSPAVFGSPVTLQVNVQALAPGGGIPDGSVQFMDNTGGPLPLGAPVVLSNGAAQLIVDGTTVPFLSAGTHNIGVVYSGATNYVGSFSNPFVQTITPGTPAITWGTPVPITYGTALSGAQLNATASVSGTFFYTPAAGTVLPVGNQTLSVTFTPTDTIDYTTVTTIVPLIVIRAPLTITAADASRAYGAANPTFTGTIGATQNGDVITATYSATATPGSPVGTYAIVPTPAGTALSNYSIVLVNGRLTVTQLPMTVTANNVSRLYGSDNPPLTGSVSGLVNGDNITVTFNSPALPASAVGNYPIVPVLSDPNNRLGNYTVSSTNAVLTVAPAPLVVIANNAMRPFGVPNPAFTGSIRGIVNNDNIAAIFSSPATPTSPPGTYPIVSALLDPNSLLGNYSVSITHGVLTVTQAVTMLNLTSSHNPVEDDSRVSFTATVASSGGIPTGNVSFFDGNKLLDIEPLNAFGVATFSTRRLSVGTHVIEAKYSGNADLQGSSAALSEVIRR
ncbi:MAG TPA: FG-GAP-like repeat-containing protein [Terriglobales bacterium]|jgi:hypothetical protein|nr:FG-GAP-like repeat-containing protein [Terriglobales bacterium]